LLIYELNQTQHTQTQKKSPIPLRPARDHHYEQTLLSKSS
jgi:hypothetical protein